MAWGAVAIQAGATTKTAGTSISANPNGTVLVGKILLVAGVTDNPPGAEGQTNYHSVSDSKGNTYTKIREQTRSPGGAAEDGVTTSLFICTVTTELTTADTITLTVSTSVDAKVIGAMSTSVGAGATWSVQGQNAAVGTSTDPSVTLSGLISQEYLWVGKVGAEGPQGDTYTRDADYGTAWKLGTTTGPADRNVTKYSQDRVATLTSDTYNPTIDSSRDWVAILAAIREVTGITYTENPRARASGVPRLALQQALTLTPKTAPQGTAQAKLTLSYILDRRAPALAEAEPLLQTTYILDPRTRGPARALTQILIPIILTPRARATARAVPTFRSALTLTPRGDGSAQVIPTLQWSAGLLSRAAGSPRAITALQAIMALSPRSLAIARALTQILIPIILSPRAAATALTATALQQTLNLTPRADGQARALPGLQQLLTLSPSTRGTALARAVVGLSYLILVSVMGRGTARVGLQQALTLSPRARVAAEAEVALQQALTLSLAIRGISSAQPLISGAYGLTPSVRMQALALPGIGLLLVISPRVQVGTAAAMPPVWVLTLPPAVLARVLATVSMPAAPIVLTPSGLVIARAIPSITGMDDILSSRITALQQDISDLKAEIASLKAREAAEWKI